MEPISHEISDCEDSKPHHQALIQFFNNIIAEYVAELQEFNDRFNQGGHQGYRKIMAELDEAHMKEKYKLNLCHANVKYCENLIEHEYSEKHMEQPAGNLEWLDNCRKANCTLLFREHLKELKEIREAMREEWEIRRTGIILSLLSTCPYDRKLEPIEPMWKE